MLRVCFNCYGNYTTDKVYQWDQNHTLHIVGLDLTYAPAVHFCNKKSSEAIVVQSTKVADGFTAPIPNELLQEPYNIIAYVHIYDVNEENAKTIEIVNIPLVKRVKPSEYQFEDNVEIKNFERLETDIADFIAKMEGEFEDYTSATDSKYEAFTTETTNNYTNFTNKVVKDYEYLKDETQSATGVKSGNVVSIEDSREARLVKLSALGKSTQKTYSGKNLLENIFPSDRTSEGITVKVNTDKSISASGTATNYTYFNINNKMSLPTGTYILSGGTENAFLRVVAQDNSISSVDDNGYGATFTLEKETQIVVTIRFTNGKTVNDIVYPMIRNANITDDTYEPYVGGEASPSPSYPQDMVSVDKELVIKSCGKNLLENTATTQTVRGITLTVNDNGLVTANGTTTGNVNLYTNTNIKIPNGDYILSGCVSGISNVFQTLQLTLKDGTKKWYGERGQGVSFTVDDTVTNVTMYIEIREGVTLNNATFYPMIRLASIEDDTYEPYVSTEASLTLADNLRGIPVASGGNYVDENGQARICDTLEKYSDGSGKLTKRVYRENIKDVASVSNSYVQFGAESVVYLSRPIKELNSEVTIISDKANGVPVDKRNSLVGGRDDIYRIYRTGIDSVTIRYPASVGEITLEQAKADFTGAEIVYILENPMVTSYSAEEMAELEKLQTFEPCTTIYTDDIGDIEVGYFKNNLNGEYIAEHNHDDRYYQKSEIDTKFSNVDNTSDLDKPISTATQEALNNKSNNNHNHDERYYSEEEVNTLVESIKLPIGSIVMRQGTTTFNYGTWNKLGTIEITVDGGSVNASCYQRDA